MAILDPLPPDFQGYEDAELAERFKPVSVRDLIYDHPDLRPVVIDGILRQGECANVIAAAKAGKSHLSGNLAWCIATGRPWLDHETAQGRVLIIDNELHRETVSHRLNRIAIEMQIDVDQFGDMVDVIPMRGCGVDINHLGTRLEVIEPGYYSLVILDALYRTLPVGTSENDNAAMMAIYNRLDDYAAQWNCSIAVVHHASKGPQGDKSITDVGSGAGSISRAADTHIVIRPHEDEKLSVLECVTRSFKSPPPVSIRFDWPIWSTVTTPANVKKPGRQSQDAQEKADKQDSEAMLAKIPEAPKVIQQQKLFEQFKFGEGKCRRLIGALVQQEKVLIRRKKKPGRKRPLVFYTRK